MPSQPVPSVSVVMPAYNAAKYLREAIDSILAQTYTDFEFIIINDGSTDDTRAIIQSYDDPRIVYLENETNSGICVTLNKGLDAARGRYIARMDADDISLPERLAIQVQYMDAHPDIAVCGTDIQVFGEGLKDYVFQQIHSPEDCVAGLLFNPCLAHPSVIIRRSILEANHLRYNDEFRGLEDFELWWNISKFSKLNNIAIPLLKYRHHKGQETQKRTDALYSVSNKFRALRYYSFGVLLSDEERVIVNNYSYGNYEDFGLNEFNQFLDILSRICRTKNIPVSTNRSALRKATGKAIAYTISQSPQLHTHTRTLLTKALIKRALSATWYFKYLKSDILSRK